MSIKHSLAIDDYIFLSETGKAIGVIAPSTLYCLINNTTYINGPNSTIKLNQQSMPALTEGLRKSGSLIEGTPGEIKEVIRLLKSPDTSRNASFFMCAAKNCAQILKDFQSLRDSKILIVGCGGIGSSVALLLAGCGIKNFTLADSDTIERSNLNRQLFWRIKDIGKHKVNALKSAITDRFENTQIETIKRKFSFDELLQLTTDIKYTTIVVTADDPATLASRCGELAKKTSTPVVSGGYLHTHCSANFFSGESTQYEFDLHEDAEHWLSATNIYNAKFWPYEFQHRILTCLWSNFIHSHGIIPKPKNTTYTMECKPLTYKLQCIRHLHLIRNPVTPQLKNRYPSKPSKEHHESKIHSNCI